MNKEKPKSGMTDLRKHSGYVRSSNEDQDAEPTTPKLEEETDETTERIIAKASKGIRLGETATQPENDQPDNVQRRTTALNGAFYEDYLARTKKK